MSFATRPPPLLSRAVRLIVLFCNDQPPQPVPAYASWLPGIQLACTGRTVQVLPVGGTALAAPVFDAVERTQADSKVFERVPRG